MKSDKRSSFEGKDNALSSHRDFSGSDYTKKSYSKERWGGDTSYERKKYAGNTSADSYRKEPWYVRKQAGASGKQASASKKKFSVNPFRSNRAAERNVRTLSSTPNSEINQQQKRYKQPNVTNWTDQRGLSVKDTNSMLGR